MYVIPILFECENEDEGHSIAVHGPRYRQTSLYGADLYPTLLALVYSVRNVIHVHSEHFHSTHTTHTSHTHHTHHTHSFGSGQISVSRHMLEICNLLSDANSQVRSCAMETLVDIYRHVGVKVRIDLSRRNLPASKMSQLTARFNAVDATTGSTETTETDVHVQLVSACR